MDLVRRAGSGSGFHLGDVVPEFAWRILKCTGADWARKAEQKYCDD